MCTVSWLRTAGGYVLFCNRDEKRTRMKAAIPRIRARNGVRFAAPVDGNFGGTWISANEYGVAVCLLNGPAQGRRGSRSRGHLVLDLADALSAADVMERAASADLDRLSSFTLLALDRTKAAAVFKWDGRTRLSIPDADGLMPLVSSSFRPDGVRARRHAELQRLVRAAGRLDASVLRAFHESHGDRPNAYSTCMHRDDAETVSFSRITVSADRAEFFYSPGAPCGLATAVTEKLMGRAA
jgi:hypothetical protein